MRAGKPNQNAQVERFIPPSADQLGLREGKQGPAGPARMSSHDGTAGPSLAQKALVPHQDVTRTTARGYHQSSGRIFASRRV